MAVDDNPAGIPDAANPEDLDPMDVDDMFMEEDNLDKTGSDTYVEEYTSAAKTYGVGTTFLGLFNGEKSAKERTDNLYYPFASREEWELAAFLLHSNLSMLAINSFLSLTLVG
jgi:hypothetical protein